MSKGIFGPTALGVDIGDDHIKLALLTQGLTKKVHILGVLAQPIDPGVIERGTILNQPAFQSVIVRGLKKFKLKVEDVVASISVPQEKFFLTTLPYDPADKPVAPAILAENHFPINAKEAEIRSEIIGDPAEKQWMVLAAVDQLTIQNIMTSCDAIHLTVEALGFDALSLVRLLRFDGSWPPFLLILDIGARHASCIASNVETGVFAHYPLTTISGEMITQVIAKAITVSADQAEALKRMYGVRFTAAQQIRIDEVIEPLAQDLAKEMNRAFHFLATHHESPVPLDIPIVLVGGVAQTIGLAERLQKSINRPFFSWQPGARFRIIPRMPKGAYPAFAVSIGSALRVLSYE